MLDDIESQNLSYEDFNDENRNNANRTVNTYQRLNLPIKPASHI